MAIPPQFDFAGEFFEGLAFATKGEVRGYINRSGQFELVLSEFYLDSFKGGLASVSDMEGADRIRSHRNRIIDRSGKDISIPQELRLAGPLSEGLAAVALDGVHENGRRVSKYGFVDRSGNVAISPQFDLVNEFHDGLAGAARIVAWGNDGFPRMKWGLIDPQARVVIPLEYDNVVPIGEGTATFWDSALRRMGLLHRSGKILAPPRYYWIEDYGDGDKVHIFKADVSAEEADFLRPDGSLSFHLSGTRSNRFSEGLARAEFQEQVGFINDRGEYAIPLKFADASNFSEGLAAAKMDLWGYINTRGEWVIPPQFDEAFEFRDGLALIAKNDTWHYIDTSARIVRANAWVWPD
jgi:hypothetical protein